MYEHAFKSFLESLRTPENHDLIQAIHQGHGLLESEFKREKLEELIKQDYGPYKNDDFEFSHIERGGWDDEVVAEMVKLSDKADFEWLYHHANQYAKKIGLKFDKTEVVPASDRVKLRFDRIELHPGYKSLTENVETYYEIRHEKMRNVEQEVKNAKEGETQEWFPIPLKKIKPIWEDFMEHGFVRFDKYVNQLADDMVNKIATLDANTVLAGHTSIDPRHELDDNDGDPMSEEVYEKFYDKLTDYIWTGNSHRLSDYGLDPLVELASKLIDTTKAEEQLMIIDRILNVVHFRSDLASWFVEGGREALDELSGNIKNPEDEESLTESVTPFAPRGSTTLDHGHTHTYQVDKDGNGVTSVDDDHDHKIANWKVQEAGDHTHKLQGFMHKGYD